MKSLVPALVLLFSLPIYANETDVFDIAAKFTAAQKGLTQLEIQKRKILSDIYSIEKETNKLVLEKNELDDQKFKLDENLGYISQKIVSMETQVQAMIPELVERLSFTEQINSLPWFYSFLTSQSLMELDITVESAKWINKHQGSQVVEFVNLVKEMEIQKIELNKTALKIVKLQNVLKNKESDIEKNQVAKKSKLKRLEYQVEKEKRKVVTLKKKGKKALETSLFKDMTMLFGSGFFDLKGKLPHPIQAQIFHKYGLNKGLLHDRVALVHKGYFYQAIDSQPTVVVAPGKVKYAGPVNGFGRMVIVDHGSRYYTSYANLKSFKVKLNQELKGGAIIGLTGHDHMQFGKGLYFEIRHFSQPQDPEHWLQKPKEHLAQIDKVRSS